MAKVKKVVVFGSLNADIVVRAPRLPIPGETVGGGEVSLIPGGKGGNQAAALAKLGWPVEMIGCVGSDGNGKLLIDSLKSAGVDTSMVRRVSNASGVALITVSADGQNTIVLAAGANDECGAEDIKGLDKLNPGDILLLQMEVNQGAVKDAVLKARDKGAVIVLNAAPCQDWASDIVPLVNWLIVNESEASRLLGVDVLDVASAYAAIRRFREVFGDLAGGVVITLGAQGSVISTKGSLNHAPAYRIEPVDTTASGDAFVGCFVGLLSAGMADPRELLRISNGAGALTATKLGAQTSLPTRKELDDFLNGQQQ